MSGFVTLPDALFQVHDLFDRADEYEIEPGSGSGTQIYAQGICVRWQPDGDDGWDEFGFVTLHFDKNFKVLADQAEIDELAQQVDEWRARQS